MNPDVKAKWVQALRSGKYKQGRGSLREHDAYCCLGVLCDIHAKETGGHWDTRGEYLDCGGILPVSVRCWAGLESRDPEVGGYYSGHCLSTHNDNGRPFPEIADLIEAHL